MTRINLLPWREAHRVQQNNKFYAVLGLCMSLAAGVGFCGYLFAEDKISFQEQRNQRLNNEIALLQEQLEEIKELTQTKKKLLARMEIIQQLQSQRPQIVHTFHEIATRLPDGTLLTSMKQTDNNELTLVGKAESNARVSALMRRMDRSDYFTSPRLDVIESDKSTSISSFKLNLVQDRPNNNQKEPDDGI